MKTIRNAIVVMFDSWQFNYTGCYGNTWIKTPNFDRFAREGVLFENCYGNGMPTLPVRRSMMTGRYGLHDTGWGPLRMTDTTIADLLNGTEIFADIVYNTPPMNNMKGGFGRSYNKAIFNLGFSGSNYAKDELYHHTVKEFFTDDFLARLHKMNDASQLEYMTFHEMDLFLRDKQYWTDESKHTVSVNIREAIDVIKKRDRNHSYHLWIDNWDPHEPWDPPSVWTENHECPYDVGYKGSNLWHPPMSPVVDKFNGTVLYTEEELHHIRMLFAEKITLCDKYFGLLCETIREEGMWENTLLWLTSDHGEPIGNGEHGHGLVTKCRPWPYEELVHQPLIIKAPGLPAGTRIKAFVQDCDCAPTILDWLGVAIPANMHGKSLLPLARGEVKSIRDYAIAGYYKFSWSIITEDWSYIHWIDKQEDATQASYFTAMAGDDCGEAFEAAFMSPEERAAKKAKGENSLQKQAEESLKGSAAADAYLAERSLDGEAQWSCTPATRGDIPEGNELYDRHKDPFQLHNVIDQFPDVAAQLNAKLMGIMEDLKNS